MNYHNKINKLKKYAYSFFISLLLRDFDLKLAFEIHAVYSEMNESILTKLHVRLTRVYK